MTSGVFENQIINLLNDRLKTYDLLNTNDINFVPKFMNKKSEIFFRKLAIDFYSHDYKTMEEFAEAYIIFEKKIIDDLNIIID